jgi:hypothetical protein
MFHIAFSLSETMPRICRVVDTSEKNSKRRLSQDEFMQLLVTAQYKYRSTWRKDKTRGGNDYAFVHVVRTDKVGYCFYLAEPFIETSMSQT